MKTHPLVVSLFCIFLLTSCQQANDSDFSQEQAVSKGKLFIIGGGKRPDYLIDRLIYEAGVDTAGYILILPMASEEEDSAIYYSSKQFIARGVDSVFSISGNLLLASMDSVIRLIQHASMIYISGGDQGRFMASIENTPVKDLLHEVYFKGATIAGTSAGAAVMSNKMITGNEKKHPVYTGNFETIEANNIEIKSGIGLLKNAIIDQHFIKRQRLNRLIAVCLENPENTCIGIDESTALLIKNEIAMVVGESQVVVLRHINAETKIVNGLLGGQNLDLSIYLPGDTLICQQSL